MIGNRDSDPGSDLVMLRAPHSMAANAYRVALQSIQAAGGPRPRACYLLVGVDDSADAAGAVANLAVASATSGVRTIVVDADVRNPRLHTLFQVPNESGLEVVAKGASAVCLQASKIPNLLVLPAGPDGPQTIALVASAEFRDNLREATASGELVLVSCAPLLSAPDATLLSSWVSGTVLVFRANATTQEHAVQARNQLQRAGSRLIGTILQEEHDR